MKHTITIFAVIMMVSVIPQCVQAYDFSAVAPTGQTLYYNIVNGNAQVTSQNSSHPYNSTYPSGVLEIPATVTYADTIYNVTSIGNYAFWQCSGITSVTIPPTVITIGLEAFSGCSGLTSVTIPNSITSIGGEAFFACTGLTSVTIPNSVTHIGSEAFGSCQNLASILVDSGNTYYDSRDNCNAIIKTDNNMLLSGCQNTIIPNSVITIGYGAFFGCNGLTSIDIPNSVVSIGSEAFWGCINLTSVAIPNTVSSIGESAFNYCSGLTTVFIPNSVSSIGNKAFGNCSGLTSIAVDSGNIYYDSRNNCNAIIQTDSNKLILGCQNTIIPSTITSIGDYAFSGSCITSINIPTSVTSIDHNAFSFCYGLMSVTIPCSIASIGNYAFYACHSMDSILCIPTTPPSIGTTDVFPYNTLIYVPCESIGTYTNAPNWSSYTSQIQGLIDTIYNCSYNSNNETFGTVMGVMDCDTNITLTATANTGYQFVAWSDSVVDNPRTIHLTSDTVMTAIFGPLSYTVNIVADNVAHGTTTGSGTYFYGDAITVSATAAYEYEFYCWSDGSMENPHTIYISGDVSLMAMFIEPDTFTCINKPYLDMHINEKYDSLGHFIGDTFYCNGIEMLEFSTEPYLPATHFNGIYTVEEIPFSPTDTSFWLNGTGIRLPTNLDDAFFPTDTGIQIPFPFFFFGIQKSQFHIGDNGIVTFTDNFIERSGNCPWGFYVPIPWTYSTSGAPNEQFFNNMHDAIYGVYEDLAMGWNGQYLSDNQGIFYDIQGEYPTRKVVVTWNQVPVFANPNVRQSYQIVFFEATNIIEIHVKHRGASTNWNGGRGIIGIQNATGQPQYPDFGTSNMFVIPGSPAAFWPAGYNTSSSPFVHKSFRFTPQGNSLINQKWYRIFDDGRDSVELSTLYDTNGYCAEINYEDTEHPTLRKIYVHPSDIGRYVSEWRFQNANNDEYVLRDTVTVLVPTYSLALNCDSTMGTIIGSGNYSAGTAVVLEAVPNDGFRFVGWSDGNTENPRTMILTSDTSLVGFFSFITYDTIYIHDTTYIDVYVHDTTTIVDTVINTVHDTVTNNIYDTTIVYSTDTLLLTLYDTIYDTIYIHDTIVVGVDEVDAINAKIYTSNGQIVVESGDGMPLGEVYVFDMMGRMTHSSVSLPAANSPNLGEQPRYQFDVPASGTYLVKIGNHPARKVVVIR